MRTSFILLGLIVVNATFAQNAKLKARISGQYIKVMNEETFISFSAKYKSETGFEPASDLEFNLYRTISDDSLVFLGKIKTAMDGKAKFTIDFKDLKDEKPDAVFTYIAKIENNDRFENNEVPVSFSDANLTAEVQTVDSVNQIKATLTDASGKPLAGQPLKVGLKRLFGSLQIGEESYQTDEDGSVLVPLGDPMPGIAGNLTFEVVLSESDNYGTLKKLVNAPIGIPIHDESTFDQRTLWSPPSKTPFYLLTFPNVIILGVWVPLLILVFNLYRISKLN